MAQYLIIHEVDKVLAFVEAKTMTAAAALTLVDDETAMIYRLAGPGKRVTARVEKHRRIEVSDAGEDQ